MYKNKVIEIEIIDSTDVSVQCIAALRQLMDYFESGSGGNGLSPLGNDRASVIAWFMHRYSLEKPNIKIT